MIQVQAFYGWAENGQMACNKATKRANRWLKEHPNAEVKSMQATHSSVISEGVAGMEYVVTLLVNVDEAEDEDEEAQWSNYTDEQLEQEEDALRAADEAQYDPDEDEEANLARLEQHWLEQKAIHRDDLIQF